MNNKIIPNVVIADDEATMRSLLKNLLQKERCNIIGQAKNGNEAIALYERKKPDIIFLDIDMPELTGLDVLKKIREEDKETMVCMVSADSQTDSIKATIELGISGFILKPFSQKKLYDIVQKFRLKKRA